ncbi:hypothetical protein DM02DRAFT_658438 [Periconia macrospinosa]|uniref:Uncharacterized protein n=1 Tax=Periconia macrospinosa TaxID=97972 RepID=A0A2V1DI03_9PLEO|nr:hypothetical protein DM02DRAFT_658438 [Periconia macrospinosa]
MTMMVAESPFTTILPEEVSRLERQDGFALLRDCLKEGVGADFCTTHASPPPPNSTNSPDPRPTWLLHRDMLHALNMPLAALFQRASTLASAALCSQSASDLELAFSGDARGAFLWLQCFLAEEDAWVRTAGCPACVVSDTLSTESHIRLTIAAALLSTAAAAAAPSSSSSVVAATTTTSPDSPAVDAMTTTTTTTSSSPSSNASAAAAEESQAAAVVVQPQLPPLPHIIPALRAAIDADPFWGPDFWSYLFSRATQLSAGIQALMSSMADLESLVTSPTPSPSLTPQKKNNHNPTTATNTNMGVRVKESKLAKRQMRLKREEMELLRRCAVQCWGRALVPRDVRARVLGTAAAAAEEASAGLGGERRGRSLTCP